MSEASKTLIILRALALAGSLLATACGSIVYKQNIQQGNVLDNEDVEALELGMTKRQVRALLGSPSVSSPFHQDRWDYMNSFSARGGEPIKRLLTLEFEGGALASMSGNYLEEASVASEALEELQEAEETPIQDLETLRSEDDPGGPGT
jgi:outer membrane protein assembly factor BamE